MGESGGRRGWALGVLVSSALAFAGPPSMVRAQSAASVGTAQEGHLVRGRELPTEGDGYHFLSNRGNPAAHFGTASLVDALIRAAAEVARAHPGSDLAIHDLSFEEGGDIRGHGSHNSGRDVDVAYYAQTADGAPINPTTITWFTANGRARSEPPETASRFDAARTWLLIAALMSDSTIRVQYVFMHPAHQRRLLAHARRSGAERVVVRQVQSILRTPQGRRVDPHADHFHLRIHCPAPDRAHGCVDGRR